MNGLQVAPAELEAKLLENQHVADAAVVGITLCGLSNKLSERPANLFSTGKTMNGRGRTLSSRSRAHTKYLH